MYPTMFPFQTPPFLPQPQQQQPQAHTIQCVNDKSSVESFFLPPNSGEIFQDAEHKKFYTKQTDASGAATIKAFDYTEEKAPKPIEYVTKAEFEKFKANLNGKGVKHEPNHEGKTAQSGSTT